jgi:putative YphP/YqiW family bacilliredoxin
MYPELMVIPMREELTRLGIKELRTVAEVDQAIPNQPGTTMVVVNSICGCAAGSMPAVPKKCSPYLPARTRTPPIGLAHISRDFRLLRPRSHCCAMARLFT